MGLVKFFMLVEVVLAGVLVVMGVLHLSAKVRQDRREHIKHSA